MGGGRAAREGALRGRRTHNAQPTAAPAATRQLGWARGRARLPVARRSRRGGRDCRFRGGLVLRPPGARARWPSWWTARCSSRCSRACRERRPRDLRGRPPGRACLPERLLGAGAVAPRAGARECRLALRATLEDGSVIDVELARIATAGLAEPGRGGRAPAPEGPFVAICMATYEPPSDMFAARSTRSAPRRTATGSASSATTARAPSASPRCEMCSPATTRFVARPLAGSGSASTATSSGPWRWLPRAAGYVAMADQDDHWHADKLETLLGATRATPSSSTATSDRRARR